MILGTVVRDVLGLPGARDINGAPSIGGAALLLFVGDLGLLFAGWGASGA